MCMSKHSPDNEARSSTTPPLIPMDDDSARCPTNFNLCGSQYDNICSNNGRCCLEQGKVYSKNTKTFCVCKSAFTGIFCQSRKWDFNKGLERTQAIAAFSAILGVLVIALFVALVVLQIKYYKRRKKRTLDDHEIDRKSKTDDDTGRKVNGTAKQLRTLPGYSWRESVRHNTKASRKLQGPSSRSVPDDLFKMGLTVALFGMKGTDQKAQSRGADAVGRCFSADAGNGKDTTRGITNTQLLSDGNKSEKITAIEMTEHTVK